MSADERAEHRKMMQSMKTRAECQAYLEKHHTQMSDRAKERGKAVPPQPRANGCRWLKS